MKQQPRELPKTKAEMDAELEKEFDGVAVEDLAGRFFSKYGHGLHQFILSLSKKQIHRVMINAFGIRYKEYKPDPNSLEGKFDWITNKLVETKTTMYMNILRSRVDDAEKEFNDNKGLEAKLIETEVNKQSNADDIKELIKSTEVAGENNGTK